MKETLSVCPVCLKRINASITRHGDDYFMEKRCDEHGDFSVIIWRGTSIGLETWGGFAENGQEGAQVHNCPDGCGQGGAYALCSGHLQKTCCALVEITHRCNLNCPVCFAGSGNGQEPSLEELYNVFKGLAADGNTFVQLSGGEPAEREDLPYIIAAAKAAGCENIQLNSNGIRLGADPEFTKKLKDAGLSFVFMQFDGTNDDIYMKLRGEALFEAKCAAIRVCGENMLGVTLVPTVVPGINDGNIGDIIKFGLKNSPEVRGVHFQPVSYFGRYPHVPSNQDRITLPEILCAIEAQTNREFTVSDFAPSSCDHPRCGFHGDFVVLPKMNIMKLTRASAGACCDDTDAHIKNRNFVARRWKRTADCCDGASQDADYEDMDTFLSRVKTHGFTITAMAFQDAYNLDIQRLRRCSLHVVQGGRLMPFCAKYLTGVKL